jgi:hypothetical protein
MDQSGEIGRGVFGKFINSKLQVYARTITPLEMDADLRLIFYDRVVTIK